MGKNKMNTSVSMFSRTESMLNSDPMQEIFELNMGEFMVEHLISKELAEKIGANVHNKNENLKNQLKELTSIYSIDRTLSILGFSSKEDHIIYNSIAKTAKQMMNIENCHIFLSKNNCHKSVEDKALFLVGTSNEKISQKQMDKMAFVYDAKNIASNCEKPLN